MATNFLNNLNYPIVINSSAVTNADNKEAIYLNSVKNRNDLNNISAYINTLLVPAMQGLASGPKYPYDAVVDGISGLTTITYPEEKGNNQFNIGLYWKKDSETEPGRPCTIKESFDYLLSNLVDRIVEVQQSTTDLTEVWEQIRCNSLNLERVKKDSLCEQYILECLSNKQREWDLSKHIYEILFQLTEGHDEAQLAELDSGADYPSLSIKTSLLIPGPEGPAGPTGPQGPAGVDGGNAIVYSREQLAPTIENVKETTLDKLSSANNFKFNSIENQFNIVNAGKDRGLSLGETLNLTVFGDFPGTGIPDHGEARAYTFCSTGSPDINRIIDLIEYESNGVPSLKSLMQNVSTLNNNLNAKFIAPIWNRNYLTNKVGDEILAVEESYTPIIGVSRDDITYSDITFNSAFVWNEEEYVGLQDDYENANAFNLGETATLKRHYCSMGESPIIMLGEYLQGDEIVAVPFQLLINRGIPVRFLLTGLQDIDSSEPHHFNANVIGMSKRYFEESILDSYLLDPDPENNAQEKIQEQLFNSLNIIEDDQGNLVGAAYEKLPSLMFREDVDFGSENSDDLRIYTKGNWEKYINLNTLGIITNKSNYGEVEENPRLFNEDPNLGLLDLGILNSDANKMCSDILNIQDDNFASGIIYYPYIEKVWELLFGETKDKTNITQRLAVAKHSRLSIAYANIKV